MYFARFTPIAAALALTMAPVLAEAQADHKSTAAERPSCFYLNQIQSQHALDDRTMLFRVNVSDIYELTFAHECSELMYPDPRLTIIPFGGNGLVCRAMDIDVKVGQQGPQSFSVPCITKDIRKLTPDDIAAIPKDKLP